MKIKIIFAVLAVLAVAFGMSQGPATTETSSYIVQGQSMAAVVEAVQSVDGDVTHELVIIKAVAAVLTKDHWDALERRGDLHIL